MFAFLLQQADRDGGAITGDHHFIGHKCFNLVKHFLLDGDFLYDAFHHE